jgi:hypothetical protein
LQTLQKRNSNNAGLSELQRLGEVDLELVDQLMRSLREKGWGRIVNVTSLASLGMMNRTAYAASKALQVSPERGRLNWPKQVLPSTRWLQVP